MGAFLFVGVFILLHQPTLGKPLTGRAKSESDELIRDKRHELEDEERSSEVQKFMLDLSSKEDMSRLKERFKSGTTYDIENDREYRRLKRFAIHDDDVIEEKPMKSGLETMKMRSSTKSRDNGEDSSLKKILPEKELSNWSENERENLKGQLENKTENSAPRSQLSDERHGHQLLTNKSEVQLYESINTTNHKLNVHQVGDGKEQGKDLSEDEAYSAETHKAGNDGEDLSVDIHHIVGKSWEIIHHYPSVLHKDESRAVLRNTTLHSEYLRDGVIDGVTQYEDDDVTQYKILEKSHRKPRDSHARKVRSIETDYEVRELFEVEKPKTETPHEENEHFLMVNTRAIKRDGYIGCFVDQHPKRDLKKMFTVNNLTPTSCRSVCREKGHAYAGVQYGYLCHCGDGYGKYGEAGEHECDSACLGDETKKCGGFWRNSVYTSDIPENRETNDHLNDAKIPKHETRSQIDRVIPIPQSEQEHPVKQDITVYLRTEIPKTNDKIFTAKKDAKSTVERATITNLKRTDIPKHSVHDVNHRTNAPEQPSNVLQAQERTDVNSNAYLHPQTTSSEFVPSNVVLRTLTWSSKKRKYTGFVKLKQNWDDALRKTTNPKTLILAGNIESAFAEMFAKDPQFEKAEVLSLREAEILDNPNAVHKVLVEFALMFKKAGKKKDEKLRSMVANNGRLGEMPVFADTLDIKEYNNVENEPNEAKTKTKREDDVDPFLQEVFRQI